MAMKARSQWRSCSIKQNNRAITALIGIDLGAGGMSEIETDQSGPDPIWIRKGGKNSVPNDVMALAGHKLPLMALGRHIILR